MRSEFEANEQQAIAIESLDGDLVVAAGAGSGKTAVLAHRFAHAVTDSDAELRADIDEVLTITFTRKAAAELRERVRRVLVSNGHGGVALARRVDEAWVSTIDSLCARLMKRHVLETGMDPALRYASEVQAAQLRRESAHAVIEAATTDGAADDLIAYGWDTLAAALVQDLEKLRSMGCRPSDIATNQPSGSAIMVAPLAEACDRLIAGTEELGEGGPAAREANLASARIVRSACDAFTEGPSDPGALLSATASVKFNAATKPQAEVKDVKGCVETLQASLGDLLLAPVAHEYVSLLSEYERSYTASKRALGFMDFGDAVEGVATLFAEHPDLANQYQQSFKLIMMDEFQDTNELQMRAIQPMRQGNLCAVGDVQQSIYGFRYADVEVMRNLAAEVDTELPLTINYRSHPDILEAVNVVFASDTLMGSQYVPLGSGRTKEYEVPWEADDPRVELHLLDEAMCDSGTHAIEEAELVASRVAGLIDAGTEPGQIGVLMQAMTHAPKIASALADRDIAAHLASGEAFFETPEIADLRALLRVIAVPEDDGAMLRVLAGPLVGLTDVELYAVGNGRERSLWQGLVDAADTGSSGVRAAETHARIRKMRDLEGAVSLADLLHRAIHEFDYDLTLLCTEVAGVPAWANINKLIRMAAEYESVASGDIGGFLEYLADYETLVKKEPVSATTVADGAVKIMSVHAAKGLQFPVVVVAGLGRGMAGAIKGRILLERDELGTPRIGMRWPDDGSALDGAKDSSYEGLKEVRKSREIEEVKRVLYVALTRAEEVLILTGQAARGKHGSTSVGLLAEALGVGSESTRVSAGGTEVQVEWHGPRCHAAGAEDQSERVEVPSSSRAAQPHAEQPTDGITEIVCSPAAPRRVPTSVSYTALHVYDECPRRFYATYVLGLKRLGQGESEALEIGSAVHLALQTGDPAGNVGRIVAAAGLSREANERVVEAINAFEGSSFAARLNAASRTFAERPFAVDLGSTRLEGKIDAIAHEPDGALIVDYKTGIDRESSRAEERMDGYRLQASCYALAALEAGESHVEVAFVFVEQSCESVTFEFSSDDLVSIRSSTLERVAAMERGEFPWLDEWDQRQCPACPAQGLCPLSPR